MKSALSSITPIQWLGIIILFNTTLIGSASQLADLALSAFTIKAILAIATMGNGFLGGLVTMFGGQDRMVRAVDAMDGVKKIDVDLRANPSLAAVAADPNTNVEAKV